MSAIVHCRTAALGGHVEACEGCGLWRIAYNSCRNRHCPKCQGAAARTWLSYRALGIKLSPFVRALHDDLMDKRNKLFAHSDVGRVEYAPPVAMHGGDKKGRPPFTILVPPRFREGTLLDEAGFEQVSVLVECTSNACSRPCM